MRRAVSFLVYLNEGWKSTDGGALRIYGSRENEQERHVDVQPEAGTLVMFRSDTVAHEVLTTHRRRQCIVGWFLITRERRRSGSHGSMDQIGQPTARGLGTMTRV